MPQARNQLVTVRRPLASRMPNSSSGRRTAERGSRHEASWAKAQDSRAGRWHNDMAGSSGARCGLVTVIVRGGPAPGHLLPDQPPPNLPHGKQGPLKSEIRKSRKVQADLGSAKFAVREAASKAHLELDQQALPYLEETLKSAKTLEVRLRVQRILEQKQQAGLTSEEVRQIRAVMVLEQIGDGESKKVLKRWAGGPVGALLTLEASAALKRLEAVSKASR